MTVHVANHFSTTAIAQTIADSADTAILADRYDLFGGIMLHELELFRRSIPRTHWVDNVIPRLRAGSFYPISQEDPFSSRCTTKPRGYAGDATIIDFLYRQDEVGDLVAKSSPAGQAIHNYWMNSPAARAVRRRKQFLSSQLMRTLMVKPDARILVIAAGHFREGDLVSDSPLLSRAQIICLDQDHESCESIRKRFNGSIFVLHRSATDIPDFDTEFDLIYAAGWYDSVNDRMALDLNARLLRSLSRSGRTIVPNLLKTAQNRASMELLQDWFLIYRDRIEICDLIRQAEPAIDGTLSYFEDPERCIGYAIFDRS